MTGTAACAVQPNTQQVKSPLAVRGVAEEHVFHVQYKTVFGDVHAAEGGLDNAGIANLAGKSTKQGLGREPAACVGLAGRQQMK